MLDKSNIQKVVASAFGALFFTFASVAIVVSSAVPVQATSPVQARD